MKESPESDQLISTYKALYDNSVIILNLYLKYWMDKRTDGLLRILNYLEIMHAEGKIALKQMIDMLSMGISYRSIDYCFYQHNRGGCMRYELINHSLMKLSDVAVNSLF